MHLHFLHLLIFGLCHRYFLKPPKLGSHPDNVDTTSDDDLCGGRDGVLCADSFNALLDGKSGGNCESFGPKQVDYQQLESRVIDQVSKDCFEQGVVELFDVAVDPDEEKNVAV